MDEPLQKFVVLVPLAFNDGTPVDKDVIVGFQEKIVGFQEKLFSLGGGFTRTYSRIGVLRRVGHWGGWRARRAPFPPGGGDEVV